ncbi:MAG: PA14 domain-containing protein [Capsulimonadales bacterium]|nr:PA14 domain-containing protein [Capsulimonadales bacterium]
MTVRRTFRSAVRAAICVASLTVPLLGPARPAAAQMVTGTGMPGFKTVFGLDGGRETRTFAVRETAVKTPTGEGANVLWPGETATFTFRFTNKTGTPLSATGFWEIIPYGTRVPVGDIWTPNVFPLGKSTRVPLTVTLPANGEATVTVRPPIPARFGGYALVADLGAAGRAFAATLVRTPKADPGRVQYPTYALDLGWPHEVTEASATFFERVGIKGCRFGAGYHPTTANDFDTRYREFAQHLEWAWKHHITVMLTVGEGGAPQPLGRPRPWLDEKGVLLDTKSDYAWLPELDPDFRRWTAQIVGKWGWPNGPVNAIELWNEPWEGISISGWGADMIRFRDMYKNMALGVVDARQAQKVDVLIGGACSSSNTRDKLFSDGTLDFLPYLDFVSIHYQPLAADPSVEKLWAERKSPNGPVRVWDTESWIANSEDRVAAVIASMRAQGQERTAGIYGGNVFESQVLSDNPRRGIIQAWSPAAAVAASQKFIGQRQFREILFRNGLPWVFVFDGAPIGSNQGRPDDGTVVVVGDLGGVYERRRVLWRGVTGLKNRANIEAAQQKLAALPTTASDEERRKAETAVETARVLDGATMTLANPTGEFVLHDFYGNPVPGSGGRIVVPLNGLGYFLRTTGKPGSFARLTKAIGQARVDGYTPVEIVLHDLTAAPGPAPGGTPRVTLHNILNRSVAGTLTVDYGRGPTRLSTVRLKPFETVTLSLPAPASNAGNEYPCTVVFDAGGDGLSRHTETLHANVIAKRTITVDGDLTDWNGTLPQSANAGSGGPTLTEFAYQPFKTFDTGVNGGQAVGYLASDDRNFYFAAKIADGTGYPGNVRFETRDDDAYFYPEKTYAKTSGGGNFAIRWTARPTAPATGAYRFVTTSDDGVRLTIKGKRVIDNWTDHGGTENEATVELKQGETAEIELDYYQGGGAGVIKLEWVAPGGQREPVPGPFEARLFRGRTPTGSPVVTRTDARINFAWDVGELPDPKLGGDGLEELVWPTGVRRFSYRKDPDLPSGNGTDNVQIAFNVLPPEKKTWLPHPPGAPERFITYQDTDYEFALNAVAPEYGGGTEIWCLQKPGMMRKHFYPRQPKAPGDGGPVKTGTLIIRRDGNTRIVECAIPWSEMPEVKARLAAGRTVKFTYRVNDNRGPAYELAADRSVSKDNPWTFHNDWAGHWANELEFGTDSDGK